MQVDKRKYEIFFRSFSESPFLVVIPELAPVPRQGHAANFVWAAVLGIAFDSPGRRVAVVLELFCFHHLLGSEPQTWTGLLFHHNGEGMFHGSIPAYSWRGWMR